MLRGKHAPYEEERTRVVGTSRRWKKSSLHPVHVVPVSREHDEKWPAWVRLLILVGASLILWGAVAVAWIFVAR